MLLIEILTTKLFRVLSKAPSTAEEVGDSPLFSACFPKNRPKTGNKRLYFHLVLIILNSFFL